MLNMPKNTAFHFSENALGWILAVLISMLLSSCSMNTAVNTKPFGQNPNEVPCVYPPRAYNSVYSVIFSHDSKTLITGCINNQILVWNAQTGKLLKSLETIIPEMLPITHVNFNSVYLSPDGNTVVNVLKYHPRGRMQIWDIQKGELLHALMGHEGWIRSVAFSPDSKIMASGGTIDQGIILWDIQTGKSLGILEEIDDVLSLAFSPDGKVLAAGDCKYPPDSKAIAVGNFPYMFISTKELIGTIHIWNVQTRELLITLNGHEKGTLCITFSPDSKILASGGWDGTVRLWDIQTSKQLKILTDTGGPVFSIAFSPDGKTFATGSWDGIVRLWDVEAGVMMKKMRQSAFLASDAVRSVAFSPDGETLAAGIMDGTAVMWNVKTGKRLKTLQPNKHAITKKVNDF
jgi:WD40 repeat protein